MKYLFIAFALTILIAACGDKPEPENQTGKLIINFNATANGQNFVLGNGYTSVGGFPYKFNVFKFYASNISLMKGTTADTILDAALIDWSNTVPNKTLTIEVPAGSYTGLRFGVGLDSIQNNYDPTSFPTSSPFSASQGTHWGMLFQYRFAMIEGELDTTNNGVIDYSQPLVYHTGLNKSYRVKEFPKTIEIVGGEERVININLDYNSIFYNATDTLFLPIDNFTHTTDDPILSGKVTNNLVQALTIQ